MLEIFFWVGLFIWLILGIRSYVGNKDYVAMGGNGLLFILFVLIGLTIYHNPLSK